MTARSVVLSVLLGAHPASATASELIRLTADFDIREPTLRVALTRMVSAGDLVRSQDGYRLADRLLARQRRQDDAIDPRLRTWDGTWTTLVITSVGIDARTRAPCELPCRTAGSPSCARECGCGPTTSMPTCPPRFSTTSGCCTPATITPANLPPGCGTCRAGCVSVANCFDEMAAATDVPGRFMVAAAMVRHILTDPVLPDELLPNDWPGAALRAAYVNFAAELVARRDDAELMEAR